MQQGGLLPRDIGTAPCTTSTSKQLVVPCRLRPRCPASVASATAAVSLSIAAGYSDRTYTYPRSAPTACAAYASPASTRCGSRSISTRSQNEPGSPSSPLPTTYRGGPGRRHFAATGYPAPPRPRKPEVASSAISLSGGHDATTSGQCCHGSSRPRMPARTTGSVIAATGMGACRLSRRSAWRPVPGRRAERRPVNRAGAA